MLQVLHTRRHLVECGTAVNLTDYNGPGERLLVVCDYYLDLAASLRDSQDKTAIWPCPECGVGSFVATFEQTMAGCTNEACVVPASMPLLELVAYLDPDLDGEDTQGAGQKFSHILEARIRADQKYKQERKERRRRAREENRWQKGLQRQRAREQGETEDTLFPV